MDASGFVRRSKVFKGNVREDCTLAEMLEALKAPRGARVVMDRGIATEERIQWLREHGYRYVVVSRQRKRIFDSEAAQTIKTAATGNLELYREASEDEVRLYCKSKPRAEIERAITAKRAKSFEEALQELSDGLLRPKTHKRLDRVWERIGRMKERFGGIGQHYEIKVQPDDSGTRAASVTWKRSPRHGSIMTHPGVYCLRSNEMGWPEQKLWRTYVMLTDLEAVFRSLKSELDLRPIYHSSPRRAEGHLFITVIAYQLVQVILHAAEEQGSLLKLDDTAAHPSAAGPLYECVPVPGWAYAARSYDLTAG